MSYSAFDGNRSCATRDTTIMLDIARRHICALLRDITAPCDLLESYLSCSIGLLTPQSPASALVINDAAERCEAYCAVLLRAVA